MEFFWEIATTIAVSLLLSLLFVKIVSAVPTDDTNEKVVTTERGYGVEFNIQNWERNKKIGSVGKVDEFRVDSTWEKHIVQEIKDESCGSPRIHDGAMIDENGVSREIEIVDMTEKPVEESCHSSGQLCRCLENEVVDESSHRTEFSEVELVKNGSGAPNIDEAEISQCESSVNEMDAINKNGVDSENAGLFDEDDWEGIERTELERLFGAAVAFVGSKCNADQIANLSSDVKLQLYGFHKIATQGPCQEPQPMPLKFSAREKWNAWQQLGIMSPEVAMEQYISTLSESFPGWMQNDFNAPASD
ncbi:Acyl-CoA-binding domain-containing protein 3 [Quillaja saponaria]|uniref:Acyl-CoA-binding domain-containing protein 3 n=1 Tax=Quillaja saponaria TaxID=32244 RepID=A0AAD7P712_QUISA|nr:Acyl-CoA-binding domain-containing protein 3 [Quillaja saponaria]